MLLNATGKRENGCAAPFFTIEAAAHLLKSSLLGLRSLHGQGIFHLDIKCENILVFIDGQVKLGMCIVAKPKLVESDFSAQLPYISTCKEHVYTYPSSFIRIQACSPCLHKVFRFCQQATWDVPPSGSQMPTRTPTPQCAGRLRRMFGAYRPPAQSALSCIGTVHCYVVSFTIRTWFSFACL